MALLSATPVAFTVVPRSGAPLLRAPPTQDSPAHQLSAGTNGCASAALATSTLGAVAAVAGRRNRRRAQAHRAIHRAAETLSDREAAEADRALTEVAEAPAEDMESKNAVGRRGINVARDMRDEKEMDRYIITFSADEEVEFRPGRILAVEHGEQSTLLSVEVETSREFVALKRAYRTPGQLARLRFDGQDGSEELLDIASPPFSLSANTGALWRLKGDLYAGETKKIAVPEENRLLIECLRPSSASDKDLKPGDEVEVGAFSEDGIDVRPVMGRFQCPALAMFCDGSHESICQLRAMLEAEDCACELVPLERTAVMLFCGPVEGLPESLSAWLASTPGRFQLLTVSEFDKDPEQSWSSAALPAIKELQDMGEGLGAVVLGSASFTEAMVGKLTSQGVRLIAKSTSKLPIAPVATPEQI